MSSYGNVIPMDTFILSQPNQIFQIFLGEEYHFSWANRTNSRAIYRKNSTQKASYMSALIMKKNLLKGKCLIQWLSCQ